MMDQSSAEGFDRPVSPTASKGVARSSGLPKPKGK